MGVIGLLNATVFYAAWMRLTQKLLESKPVVKVEEHNPAMKWLRPFLLNRMLPSPTMRWISFVQSVAFLVGAALWFLWRP
jgi:hypothetical protein